jgi:hypothetical protein
MQVYHEMTRKYLIVAVFCAPLETSTNVLSNRGFGVKWWETLLL